MSDLTRRTLGRTGLEVTQLGFGAAERGLPDSADFDAQAAGVLNAGPRRGRHLIDTAPDYGASEERIGRYVGHRRREFHLATKCGLQHRRRGQPPWSRATCGPPTACAPTSTRVSAACGPTASTCCRCTTPPWRMSSGGGLIEALEEIRGAGKARFIGVSSTNPHLAAFVASGAFDVFQIPYSALEREHETMMQEAADAGAGILVRGGISLGHRANEGPPGHLGEGGPGGGRRRHEPPRVHPALHPRPTPPATSTIGGHHQPRPHAVQPRRRPGRPPARRSLRRGQDPAGGHRRGPRRERLVINEHDPGRRAELQAAVEAMPRVGLAALPTPFEPCPHLSKALGGPRIWIKRDDLTGLAAGGNKTRMFEFVLGKALEEGADTVVGGAAVQSNYCPPSWPPPAPAWDWSGHLVLRKVRGGARPRGAGRPCSSTCSSAPGSSWSRTRAAGRASGPGSARRGGS